MHPIRYYKQMNKSVKCSLYFVLCSLIQKGIAFITIPIFTRIMTTDEYGHFSTFHSWQQIIIIFTSINIAYGILNKALTKFKNHNLFIGSAQALYSVITIIIFFLYQGAKLLFGQILDVPVWVEALLFISMLVTPALDMFSVKSRYELKYGVSVVLTIALAILNPLLGLLMISFGGDKGLSRIESYLISQIIICLPVYIYNFVKAKRITIKYWKYVYFLLKIG